MVNNISTDIFLNLYYCFLIPLIFTIEGNIYHYLIWYILHNGIWWNVFDKHVKLYIKVCTQRFKKCLLILQKHVMKDIRYMIVLSGKCMITGIIKLPRNNLMT